MQSNQFVFSGISLLLRSEENLKVNKNLRQFEVAECDPDVIITFRFDDVIPEQIEERAESFLLKSEKDANGQETAYAYVDYCGNECKVTALSNCRNTFDVTSVLRTSRFPHMLLKFNAFILHASYVLVNGEAILFSAPSGTGKSTQADLWKKYRNARIINGDRVLVRRTENGFTAGGIHYSGSSEYCENVTAPIRAIVLLSQAKQNTVKKCGGAEAFRRLFHETTYTNISEDPATAAQLIASVVNSVDIVKLECLPDKSAVTALENYLAQEK